MDPQEFYDWLAYYQYKAEEEKKALDKAKKSAKKR